MRVIRSSILAKAYPNRVACERSKSFPAVKRAHGNALDFSNAALGKSIYVNILDSTSFDKDGITATLGGRTSQ